MSGGGDFDISKAPKGTIEYATAGNAENDCRLTMNPIPAVPLQPPENGRKADANSHASATPSPIHRPADLGRCRRPTQHTKPRSWRAKSDGSPSIVGRCRESGFIDTGCKSRRAVTPFTIPNRAAECSPARFRRDNHRSPAAGVSRRLWLVRSIASAVMRIPAQAKVPVALTIQVPCVSSGLSSSQIPLSFKGSVPSGPTVYGSKRRTEGFLNDGKTGAPDGNLTARDGNVSS